MYILWECPKVKFITRLFLKDCNLKPLPTNFILKKKTIKIFLILKLVIISVFFKTKFSGCFIFNVFELSSRWKSLKDFVKGTNK